MKRIFYPAFFFLLTLISCQKAVVDDVKVREYREKFYGNYNFTIHTSNSSMGQYHDTTMITVGSIGRFDGYSTNTGSNYVDVEHKIGIVYDPPFDFNVGQAKCQGMAYYTRRFMHPTVSLFGTLSYPELDCSYHTYFGGEIIGDSIHFYINQVDLGAQSSLSISGVKIH